MVSVHCADDMPEIERLRARVAELEAAAAQRAIEDERVNDAHIETVASVLTAGTTLEPCGHLKPGRWCEPCVDALEDHPEVIAARDRERAEDDAREREVDELRGENADLRRALEAVRTSHPGDYVVTYAHPNEALRAEVQALRALVASLRADVRAISDSIDADAARASAEARRVSGYARAAALTPERRREIARNAGRARWRKVRDVLEDSQPLEAPPCD